MSDVSRVEMDEWRPVGEAARGAPRPGAGDVAAILPNGRVVWLRFRPSPAPASALERLAWVAHSRAERRRKSARRQVLAVAVLSRTAAAITESLGEAKLARTRRLRRRLVKRHRKLDERITGAAEKVRSQLRKQHGIQSESVQRIRRRDLWDKAVLATSLPLFAAFGQKGRPFGVNNVALTISSLVWLVGDDVVEAIFGPEEKSPYPVPDLDAWSYIAPVANLLSGWWLLSDFQHERFVTGRVAIPLEPAAVTAVGGSELEYRYVAQLDLSRVIATSHRPSFEAFRGVPAVATIATVVPAADGKTADARITALSARVRGTDLLLTVTAVAQDLDPGGPVPEPFSSLDVAWMVDTQKPAADASS